MLCARDTDCMIFFFEDKQKNPMPEDRRKEILRNLQIFLKKYKTAVNLTPTYRCNLNTERKESYEE